MTVRRVVAPDGLLLFYEVVARLLRGSYEVLVRGLLESC